MTVSADNQELAQIVQQIHNTIRPNDEPSDQFRDQLRTRLVDELNRSTREERIVQFQRQRTIRRVAQAAALFVVVGALAVILDGSGLIGTAGGDGNIASMVIAMVVVAIAGVAIWLITNRET